MSTVKKARFFCLNCHHEVFGRPFQGWQTVGWYAYCPRCGAENQVDFDDWNHELDVFEDEEVDGLAAA